MERDSKIFFAATMEEANALMEVIEDVFSYIYFYTYKI